MIGIIIGLAKERTYIDFPISSFKAALISIRLAFLANLSFTIFVTVILGVTSKNENSLKNE